MTRSLPEQEVLKYLAHGHPLPTAEGSSNTTHTLRYAALLTASVCSPRIQLLSEAVLFGLCVSCLVYLLCYWVGSCSSVMQFGKFASLPGSWSAHLSKCAAL